MSWWAELPLQQKVEHILRSVERYGPDDHHAWSGWAYMPSEELQNLRMVKRIEDAFAEAGDDAPELIARVTDDLGVHPELLLLKLKRWLGWYAIDQARQVEACEALGLPWPPAKPDESPEWWPLPARCHFFRWAWEERHGRSTGRGGAVLPVVYPSTYTAHPRDPFVERWVAGRVLVITAAEMGKREPVVVELERPEPRVLPPEPRVLPPAPKALGPGPKVAARFETREERQLRGVWNWSDITPGLDGW